MLKCCGTTIPYPMWNHLTKLYYKVEKFTKKCGTIISIHTKYYGKPSGTIAVPLVNVEPFSPYSSHKWNHFPNSYLILWKTKWNHHGSTCGTICPGLGKLWNQYGSTLWLYNVVSPECGTKMVPQFSQPRK